MSGPNHPFVLWGSCFLWLTSMIAITWSLILLFFMGDMLLITETDLVITILLLSGIIMLPTNIYMLYTIANGQKVSHKSKVLCCPLWMLILWIIVINCVGVALSLQRIYLCNITIMDFIDYSMKHYRNVPKYKRFMDNLQWSLKCCGLYSYKDWFNHDWYDKLRDYEWKPSKKSIKESNTHEVIIYDSVPLSCCKSGTCVPNYLLELGTHSIHTNGCKKSMYQLYMTTMNIHLIIFFMIVIAEIALLSCIIGKFEDGTFSARNEKHNVENIMPVNNKFEESNNSSSSNLDDDSEYFRN